MRKLIRVDFFLPLLCTAFFLMAIPGYGQQDITIAEQNSLITPQNKSFYKVRLTQHISVKFNNTPMELALRQIARESGLILNYRGDYMTNKLVTFSSKKITVSNALDRVLENTNLEYLVSRDGYLVIKKIEPKTKKTVKKAVQFDISGKVIDSSTRESLPGVNILVKGTSIGTATDPKGNYSLSIPSPNDTLIFSFIGYQTRIEPVNDRQVINVMLQSKAIQGQQMVVIGYQSVARKDLTGAVSTATIQNVGKVTSGDIGGALQGLIPGVTVRNGGRPGSNSVINIRGVGSFGDSAPLVVIDGVIASGNTTFNPDNVASVQVLKDASAAAIYGAQAANGVIIITTKKGKEGPAKFSVSAKYGVQQLPKTWNMMNAQQYLATVQKEYSNSGIQLPVGVAAQVANNTINTNWQNAVFRNGNDQDYNLSISGGNKTSDYLISGSYYRNKGVLLGNNFERTSLRVNSDVSKGIVTIGEHLMLSNSIQNNPGGGVNAFYDVPQMLPIIGVQGNQYKTIPSNPEGWGMGTTEIPTYASNYVANNALDKEHNNASVMLGNVDATVKLTDWLNYKLNLGGEITFNYYKAVRDTGIWRYTNQPPATSVSETRALTTNYLVDNTLNFNKTFGRNVINGVVGFSRRMDTQKNTIASKTYLQRVNGELLTTIGSATGTPTVGGNTLVDYTTQSYLGRINYTYDNKYLLTFTGRIDQDSRFGPAYRTGYFPSVAAAWRINREKFFKVSWVNDLKLRASYGKLGFSNVLGSWDYFGTINNNPRAVYGVNQTPLVGEYQAAITNPDLRWETRTQKDVGLDATILDNKMSITLDYYDSQSKGVLVNLPLPLYLGSSGSAFVNAGSIENNGFELAVTYRHEENPFRWDVSANMTTIKNKVLSVGNQGVGTNGKKINYLQPTNFIRAQVGHPIGAWYVIKTDGIFQNQTQINNYVDKNGNMIQPNAKPGDIKYIDANGDGMINDADRQFAGSPWPKVQAGAQFNGSYKNFTLNVQLVGVFGDKLYNDVRRVLDSYQLTNFRKGINPWSTSNPKGTDPRLAVEGIQGDPEVSLNNLAETSRWLENGSYVRIRNIELDYSVPQNLLKNTGLAGLEIYLSAQNLVTITGYKGLDPDVQGTGIISRGFDAGNWPASRIVSAGLHLNF